MFEFISFCVREISGIKNVINKARVAENKIHLKYSHHLFFCPKNKSIYMVSLLQKNSPQSRLSIEMLILFISSQ